MEFVEFSSQTDSDTINMCVNAYCAVFREPPWNETWNPEDVLKNILDKLPQFGFHGLLAIDDGQVVGFTWGYPLTRESLRKTASHSMLDFLFLDGEQIFYVSELGVLASYRGKKIGKDLSCSLLNFARKDGHLFALLRTDKEADCARGLYDHLGFQELQIQDGSHPDRTYWLLKL